MTTPSPKLALALPTVADPFSTADLKANYEKIDAAPGAYICTSTTRPTWAAGQAGRKIIETDTLLEWVWDGDEWKRLAGIGLLKKNDGTFAIGERTTDFSTTSNTFVKVVTVTDVVVPAGNRPIRVDLGWFRARNPDGNFLGAIFRSDTNNSGPKQVTWQFGTTGSDANAGGGTFWSIERNGLAAGTYNFSFQITAPTGTSRIDATTGTPTTIAVSEM
jgi:hypothetical protein